MPLKQADVDAVKALLKAGRINEARGILASIDGDKARAILAKFNEKYPQKATKPRQSNYLTWGLIGVTVIGILFIFGYPAIQQYRNRVPTQLESICRDKYMDGWLFDKEYNYAQLSDGCKYAVLDAMRTYDDEIRYCVNEYGQTDKRLAECLDTEEVYFSRSFIWQARDNPEVLQTPGQYPTPDFSFLTPSSGD